MTENSRDLISELAKARQTLTDAEARVTELETALHSIGHIAHQPSFFNTFLTRFDVRVSVGYGIVATLWILFSDHLPNILITKDLELSAEFSLLKGLAFVWVTATILFILLYAELRKRKYVEQALVRDLIQRKQVEENVKKLNRTLSVLSDINQAIVRTRDIQKLFEETCKIAVEKAAFRMAWVGLLDTQTTQIKPVAQAGMAEEYLNKLDISLNAGPATNGPTATAIKSGNHVVVNDIAHDPIMESLPWQDDAIRLGYRSSIALPLVVKGEARGIYHLYSDVTDFFDEPELRLMDEMAGDIAFAMEFAEKEAQRERDEQQIKRLYRTLSVLSDINQAIVRIRDIQKLFEEACAIAVEKGAFRMAWIGLLDTHTTQVKPVAQAGFTEDYLDKLNISLDDELRGRGPTGNALRSSQPVIVNNVQTDPQMQPWRETALQLGYNSTAALPLIVSGEPRGILALYSNETGFFDEQEVKLIAEMAGDISFAMEFAGQESRRQQSEIELQRYAKRMEILHEIDTGIINSKSIQSVVEIALKQVRKIIPCQRVSLMLLDEITNEWLIFVADTDSNTPLGSGTRIPNLSTPSEQFRTGRIAATNDLRLLSDPSPAIQQLINDGLLSSLHAHFVVANQSLGSLNLFADSTNYFSSDDQEIAAEIADQLAIAIKQMRLSDEIAHHAAELEQHNLHLTQAKTKLERYAKRMEVLHEIDKGLIQGTSIQLLVQATLNHVRQLIPCQQANVTIVDHVTHEGLIFALDLNGDTFFTQGVRSPLPADVFEGYDEKHIRIFEDIRLLQDTSPRAKQLVSEGMRSLLSALLMDQNTPIGSLVLVADTSEFFTTEYQEIATQIAAQLAIAVRQMRMLDEVHQSETQYRLLAENMVDVIWVLDAAALRFTYISPSVQQLRGYTPEEVLNQTMAEAFTPASLQLMIDSLPERIEAFVAGDPQAISQAHEVEQVCKDGSTVWTEVVTTLLQDGTGAISLLGVSRDITDRRQAEAELREREEWIRLSMEASGLGKWRYDIEKGVLYFDERASKHYGLEHNVVTVDEVLARIHPDDVDRFKQELSATLDPAGNYKTAMEYRILLPDGTERWLSALAHIYFEGQGDTRHAVYGFGTSQDITERKRAEDALRKAEAQERAMLSAIPDIIFRYDAEGKFLDYHAPDSTVLAAPPEVFLGKKAHDVLPPDLADSLVQHIQQVLSTKQSVQFEYILPVITGTREFEARLVPVSENEVLAIVRDVTERRLAERELQALYNATSYLFKADNVLSLGQQIVAAVVREFEHADCGVVLLDRSKGKIIRLARIGQADLHPDTQLELEGSGLIPQALRTGEVVYEPDVSQNSHYVSSVASTLSEFVIPLKTSNGIIGALDLQHAEKDAFSERDRRILTAYAERAAPAIEIMQLYDELNHYAVELESRVAQRTGELNHAKERAEAILNHSIDGIVLTDSQLVIQQTNLAFNALFSVEPDAYFEKSFGELLSEPDAQVVEQIMLNREAKRLEITAHRKNGTVFDAEFGFGFIKNDGIVCIISDITERKAQERQLRYYASLQESVVDAVIVTDIQLHIQTWNQGAERIYGWTADEVIGKVAPDLLHIRRSSAQDIESLGQRLIEQGFIQQETIQQHKDGTDIFILGSATLLTDENGVPVGVISVNRDISERKAAERQLRFDAAVQESISDAVIVTDTKFHIQSWNKAAEMIYGWRSAEAIGKMAEILQTRFESDEERNQSITGLFSQGQWRDEFIQQRKDGSELYVLSSTSVLKDENDVPIGVIAVNRDITVRKRAEEALKNALEKEKELNELKTRFVSTASHEFRTPLATILAVVETLLAYRRRLKDEEIDDKLSKITDQVTYLKTITEDMLQVVRLQDSKTKYAPTNLNLDALCRSVIDEFESRADVTQKFVYSCDRALHQVSLDPKLMRQIMSNLVSNAVKYSPPNKTITISLKRTEASLILKIQDEGIGIPEADLKHLFEPFHRATNVGTIPGTGLGLVITKESVELHSGFITVDSQLGIGTTFTIMIPLADEKGGHREENSAH